MILKFIEQENFNHYKKPAMVLAFPRCDWKCEKDCGKQVCQNGKLASLSDNDFNIRDIIDSYLNNNITSALVCAGLEPFDSWSDLEAFILNFREYSDDDIVIYTGYYENEIPKAYIDWLKLYGPIYIKFGRFIPNQEKHLDEVLGVYLASSNQFCKRLDEPVTRRVIINPDKEVADYAIKCLKDNDGYCPCKFDKTPETKCRCKEFTDMVNDPNYEGLCSCGLYYKYK